MNSGLVKDGDVIESQKAVVKGIEDHIENLYKQGDIKEKDYKLIKDRIASYTDEGVVNLTELLTIAGELMDAGVLNLNSKNSLLALKLMINKFTSRKFGDGEMFFRLNENIIKEF